MEEKTTPSAATLEEKNAAISAFFERMGYSDEQRAMFYLGRILSSVARAQKSSGHDSKPILNKINFNGMDASDLKRLQIDLFEKCKQYTRSSSNVLAYNEMNFSKLTDLFKDSKTDPWDKRMKANESLFYLLSGYSFWANDDATQYSESPKFCGM